MSLLTLNFGNTQMSTFSKEIHSLSKGEAISQKSSFLSLNPFLDKGIIKVGGHLSNAEIPESQRHPIVLPRNHHIKKLLIREEHIRGLHAGTQATLYGVTKAVHLELVSDLTTEAFLSCLKRFFALRGKSTNIYSDNATNFLGVRNELKELYSVIQSAEQDLSVQKFLTEQKIT